MAPLSPTARERLTEELARLREERRLLTAREAAEVRMGDLADQADVMEREDAVTWLDRRIAQIDELLRRGVDDNLLSEGTEVTLEFDDGEVEMLRAVAIPEAAPDDDISTFTPESPLGLALVGRAEGDRITYRTPAGNVSAKLIALKVR
jgi:transcription elongation GreA/GreB family factor